MLIQLDWKTISATMITISWVLHNTRYDMSHISVIRLMSRLQITWSPIKYFNSKKVSFLRPIFHVHEIKKNIGDQAKMKIWLKKFLFFLVFYFNFHRFTRDLFLNSNILISVFTYTRNWVEKPHESDWSIFFLVGQLFF